MLVYRADNLYDDVASLEDITIGHEVQDGRIGNDYEAIWIDNEQTDCSHTLMADVNVEMSRWSNVVAFIRHRYNVDLITPTWKRISLSCNTG